MRKQETVHDHEVTSEALAELLQTTETFLPSMPQHFTYPGCSGSRGIRWNAYATDEGEVLVFSRDGAQNGDSYREYGVLHRAYNADSIEEYYAVSLQGRPYVPLYRESTLDTAQQSPYAYAPLDKYPQLAEDAIGYFYEEMDDAYTDPRANDQLQSHRDAYIDYLSAQKQLSEIFQANPELMHGFSQARAHKLAYILGGLEIAQHDVVMSPEKIVPTDTECAHAFILAQNLYASHAYEASRTAHYESQDYSLAIDATPMEVHITFSGDTLHELVITKIGTGNAYSLVAMPEDTEHEPPELSWLEVYIAQLTPRTQVFFSRADLRALVALMEAHYVNDPPTK